MQALYTVIDAFDGFQRDISYHVAMYTLIFHSEPLQGFLGEYLDDDIVSKTLLTCYLFGFSPSSQTVKDSIFGFFLGIVNNLIL